MNDEQSTSIYQLHLWDDGATPVMRSLTEEELEEPTMLDALESADYTQLYLSDFEPEEEG